MEYEVIIGLEIHAQLSTNSKMFCSCSSSFGDRPNTNICPVCTAQPGSLPLVNKKAVSYATKAAMSLNCKINKNIIFARKNYFYPDLPKGYQISQEKTPIGENGFINIELENGEKKIGITRVHMEEDAGKNIHKENKSLIDLNRAGVPLIEIVSEPDIRNPMEATCYLKKIKAILSYLGICDCNMEKGNLRCDANISLKKKEGKKFGTKVEIKNLNSFKFIEKALNYEIKRQKEVLEKKEKIVQETMLFDVNTGVTKSLRKKETSNDYRYFPEPDILPLCLDDDFIEKEKNSLPELCDQKKERFMKDYKLSSYDASILSSDIEISKYFESLNEIINDPKISSNWIQSEVMRELNNKNISIKEFKISAKRLSELILLIKNGTINNNTAKKVFSKMILNNLSPEDIIEKENLGQITDKKVIKDICIQVLKQNKEELEKYKSGKTKLFGFFVGQVMKETKGKASPEIINKILKETIN
jgi:aspartyl-tRNA(Asn)/glutamyl-tRNA(Gln) amidotransferase subunit B